MKDNVYIRRTGGQMGSEVNVAGDLIMYVKEKRFLENSKNKQKSVHLGRLNMAGVEFFSCRGRCKSAHFTKCH